MLKQLLTHFSPTLPINVSSLKAYQSRTIQRLVICTGSCQLITALAVLKYREAELEYSHTQYQDYLVLCALGKYKIEEFAAFISQMAVQARSWHEIIYIGPEQTQTLYQLIINASPFKAFNSVYQLLGIRKVDEIYLSHNWLLEEKIVLNAYSSAYKICYGDGIGIYYASPQVFYPNLASASASFSTNFQHRIKQYLNWIKQLFYLKNRFKPLSFDYGYLFLEGLMGDVPMFSKTVPPKEYLRESFLAMGELIPPELVSEVIGSVKGYSSIAILLTSYFSEAERMSLDSELLAYQEYLSQFEFDSNTILLVKPHPRDDHNKLTHLQRHLSHLFAKVLTFSSQQMSFLPFEVFFQSIFITSGLINNLPIQVFAVSSSALSLPFLFSVPCHIGFGEKIATKLFHAEYLEGRLTHEIDLRAALKNFEQNQV